MNIMEPPANSTRFFEVYKFPTLTGNPVNDLILDSGTTKEKQKLLRKSV